MAKRENIGPMRERVTLYTLTTTQNAHGEYLKAFTSLATVWAAVEYGRGDEDEGTGRVTAMQRVTIRIRYRSDFQDERARIVWESKTWEIESVENDSHRMYSTIRAVHQET